MPKILEHVREQLLTEVRQQIEQHGYAQTTIRSVARACGVGVGTVYNYFPSKDMLIAAAVADDWYASRERFLSPVSDDPRNMLYQIYEMLHTFSDEHHTLFTDPDAAKVFSSIFSERHAQLRDQLADWLLPICKNDQNPEFLSRFLAESLLTWTMEGISFAELFPVLEKILSIKETDHE